MQLKNFIVTSIQTKLTQGHIDSGDLLKIIKSKVYKGEAYCALFDMEDREDFISYQGLHYPMMGWVVIDIDVKENLQKAHEITAKILESFGLKESFARVYFSGSKGFHIYIRCEYFGITKPTADCSARLKDVLLSMSEKYGFAFDRGNYHANRKFRLPNSINEKSKLYKIELTFDQFYTLSIEEIKEKAKSPGPVTLDIYDTPEPKISIETSEASFGLPAKIDEETNEFKTYKNKPCIEKLLQTEIDEGNRHYVLIRLVGDLYNQGLTDDDIRMKVIGFASKNNTIDRFEKEFGQALRDAKNGKAYTMGCYEDYKKSNCSGVCGLYKKLDPFKRAVVEDAPKDEIKIQKQVEEIKEGKRPYYPDVKKVDNAWRPLNTFANFTSVMKFAGITAKYDVIKKDIVTVIPGYEFNTDNEHNDKLNAVMSVCNKYDMPSYTVDSHLLRYAGLNCYNSVANFIESKPWDGVSRLKDLFNTIEIGNKEEKNAEYLKELLMKKWLVSAVRALYATGSYVSPGVLVLKGDQNIGKTYWLKKLLPKELSDDVIKDGFILNLNEKDSRLDAIKYWIVEMGEFDATFKRSDISGLKAFFTQGRDTIRVPYAKAASTYCRRTVFFASVNPDHFLNDTTGNRRYWVINAQKINFDHNIDMQQLWAEVKTIAETDFSCFLSQEENKLLNESNEAYTPDNPLVEQILKVLGWNEGYLIGDPVGYLHLSAVDILNKLGFDNPDRTMCIRASDAMKQITGKSQKRSKAKRYYEIATRVKADL